MLDGISWIDVLSALPIVGFGMWCLAFPHSYIRLYTAMYRRTTGGDRQVAPKPAVVRVVGGLSLIALAWSWLATRH